ncbi:hypothetical protein PM082_016018 [Marasmius tenuissimus]|nr:hypothetical protein PM082_016018 [Marasmius tenuissimus]
MIFIYSIATGSTPLSLAPFQNSAVTAHAEIYGLIGYLSTAVTPSLIPLKPGDESDWAGRIQPCPSDKYFSDLQDRFRHVVHPTLEHTFPPIAICAANETKETHEVDQEAEDGDLTFHALCDISGHEEYAKEIAWGLMSRNADERYWARLWPRTTKMNSAKEEAGKGTTRAQSVTIRFPADGLPQAVLNRASNGGAGR